MIFTCCSEERRTLVKEHPSINGIDFIEVLDDPKDPPGERQTTLLMHFIKDLQPGIFNADNICIVGGERIPHIHVVEVFSFIPASPPASPPSSPPHPSVSDSAKLLWIKVDRSGDFSPYSIHLVKDSGDHSPPDGFDPILSSIDFSFKVACPNEVDCKSEIVCATRPAPNPNINYLAKDYSSFRRLMLDRMALLLPEWKVSNPADLGMTLVELLAYAGDHLSYHQDAIATEAYIGTARKRISVRRHARLVDYFMHDGSNSRVWAQVVIKPEIKTLELKKGEGQTKTKLVTSVSEKPIVINYNSDDYEELSFTDVQIFELMHDSLLISSHNRIRFHTWGDKECCLPKGATSATLLGKLDKLKVGDILILTEVMGPKTGMAADADPSHRHAIRITGINIGSDPIGLSVPSSPVESPPDNSIAVTEIKWHSEDALPFPLCISSRSGTSYFEDVSVVLGNIVLADHGLTSEDDNNNHSLNPSIVPAANPLLSNKKPTGKSPCQTTSNPPASIRYRPLLTTGPVTQAASYEAIPPYPSSKAMMEWSLADIKPEITLRQEDNNAKWIPRRDLLNSNHNSKHFVVEIEANGATYLRFGDNTYGAKAVSGARFKACFRTGNGSIGNIGAEKLAHIVSNDPIICSNTENILKVWNPLPAKGGIEPESMEEVRQKAGYAFRKQERAVTAEDFAYLARKSDSSVQRATASHRWTGSWYTAFVTFDRYKGEKVDEKFEKGMIEKLNPFRMAGQDLEIDSPRFIPLEVEMIVCVKKDYFVHDVKNAILLVFSNGYLPDGEPALFHPDNFTFGQTLYLSTYYAAAQAIPGVKTVRISKFQRFGIKNDEVFKSGKFTLGRLEIARLENNPNYREHGIFNLLFEEGE